MNYEDDELERMRARREGRSSRASQEGHSSVLRGLEVEKRVRDDAAAITVNRRVTESI